MDPAIPPSPLLLLQTLRHLIVARRPVAPARRYRLTLHIAGPAEWSRQVATTCLDAWSGARSGLGSEAESGAVSVAGSGIGSGVGSGVGVWLSDPPLEQDQLPQAAGLSLLGRELDHLVYDAQGGFDPDSFGAACGALRGGGLLLLLTPPLARWADLPDPQWGRIAVAPHQPEQLSGRYLKRLARVLAQGEGLIRLEPEEGQGCRAWPGWDEGPSIAPSLAPPLALAFPQAPPAGSPQPAGQAAQPELFVDSALLSGSSLAAPPVSPPTSRPSSPATDPTLQPHSPPLVPGLAAACRTSDQVAAVASVLRTARGRARRPQVIVSDRGRGKTAALGLAARQLLVEGVRLILVTAPRLAALEPLFRHAAAGLAGAQVHRDRISLGQSELRFLPPDLLVQGAGSADLVLVDEAAALPAPMLERLLTTYPRLVFATTVQGYEGTGRGFEVRFQAALQRLTPAYRRLELKTPIRWAPDDPLEALVNRALLLDARPAEDWDLAGANTGNCDHALLDRDQLVDDEASLAQLFGLLILAHYQTRPMDLRHLLDGPNLQVHALRHRGQIAATALVAREGGLSPELAKAVFEGRRRPQGHLLPQTLSAHAGLRDAPGLLWARVIRIAVHPACQGRGLGRRLMRHIACQARADHLDLVGVSFGATLDLLAFWSACGLAPIHLGSSRNAASGAHAAVVALGLTPAGGALAALAGARFQRRFPRLLAGPFRHLEPDLAAELLALSQFSPAAAPGAADEPDWEELAAFAYTQRPFEASLASLQALACTWLGPSLRQGHCRRDQAIPLILAALQCREGPDAFRLAGANGRAQFIALLRESCARLLSYPPCE